MSGPCRSKLPLVMTRQQKYQKEAVEFMKKHGEYTTARKIVAHNLLIKLKANIAEFHKVDEEWTAYIRTIIDATLASTEQALYDKHAVLATDPDRIPYMQLVQSLEEAVADVETEMMMIENSLNAAASLNSSSSFVSSSSAVPGQVVVIQTPAHETKKRLYYGDRVGYKAFIADHEATVGSKPGVPRVTKLALLKERLAGAAYDCVKLYTTDDDYPKALDKLKQRFGVESDAIAELRSKIRASVRNKEDYHEVRKAFDEFEYHLTTLGTYGEDIESTEFFEALKRKLPRDVLLRVADYERLRSSTEKFNVTELRKAVDSILSDFERVDKLSGKANRYNRFRKGRKSTSPKPKTVASNTKKDKKNGNTKNSSKPKSSAAQGKAAYGCAFCEGPHYSDDCPVEKTVEEAKECAAEKHLCFECFRAGHQSNNCRSKVKCRKCGGSHHTVYCKADRNSSKSTKGATKRNDAPAVAVNLAFKQYDESEVLLLTTEVVVSNPKCPDKRQNVLAFIDPGSQ